jgi:HEPN domain-containing protein
MFEDVYPKELEISAFHSQQSAEKVLKAFLVAHDIEPPKIHDLEKIVKLCKNINGDFSQIEIDCQKITPYGVASRYPDEIAVDEAIVKTLIERAQKIYDFCLAKIPKP